MSGEELRAMVLLTLPYPPLPVLVTRIQEDSGVLDNDSDAITTSHTLIAKGLIDAMVREDPTANAQRAQSQKHVFQRFLHAMASEGFATTDPDRLYYIYTRFTIEHIATYFPKGHPLDIRIAPLSYITNRDKFHNKLAEYMAAQSIFFEDPVPVPRDMYIRRSPSELLFTLRERLGHVMTAEERSRIDYLELPIAVDE